MRRNVIFDGRLAADGEGEGTGAPGTLTPYSEVWCQRPRHLQFTRPTTTHGTLRATGDGERGMQLRWRLRVHATA